MHKTDLEDHEYTLAYLANRHWGWRIEEIAMMYVVNQGRVSEAITTIEYVLANRKEIYAMAVKAKNGEAESDKTMRGPAARRAMPKARRVRVHAAPARGRGHTVADAVGDSAGSSGAAGDQRAGVRRRRRSELPDQE